MAEFQYVLKVQGIAPIRRIELERILPCCDSIDFDQSTNTTSYVLRGSLTERVVQKVVKIAETLKAPYELRKF